MYRCEGYGFQAVYSRIEYINHSLSDQSVEDFIKTKETRNSHSRM